MEGQKTRTWADILEAKLSGRAPRSAIAIRLISISAVLLCCAVSGPTWFESVLTMVRDGFRVGHVELDVLMKIWYRAAWACCATAVIAVVVGILLTYVHTGFLWSLGLLSPSFGRRFEGYQRVQGEHWTAISSLVVLLLAIVVSVIGLRFLLPECVRLLSVPGSDLPAATFTLWRFCLGFGGVIFGLVALIMAITAWITFWFSKTGDSR